jgi:hypothetical protein
MKIIVEGSKQQASAKHDEKLEQTSIPLFNGGLALLLAAFLGALGALALVSVSGGG